MNTITRLIHCGLVDCAITVGAREAAAQPPMIDGAEIAATYGVNRDLISFAEPFAIGLRLGGLRDVRIDNEPTHQRSIGINVAAHVSSYLLAFSEFIYNDFGESHFSGRVGFLPRMNVVMRTRFYEWTGGMRVQFPAGSWRVRPYFGGGGGIVRVSFEADSPVAEVNGNTDEFTYNLHTGVRIFAGHTFAIAPEFRVVQIPDDTVYRALVSAVFRFN